MNPCRMLPSVIHWISTILGQLLFYRDESNRKPFNPRSFWMGRGLSGGESGWMMLSCITWEFSCKDRISYNWIQRSYLSKIARRMQSRFNSCFFLIRSFHECPFKILPSVKEFAVSSHETDWLTHCSYEKSLVRRIYLVVRRGLRKWRRVSSTSTCTQGSSLT